LYASDLRFDIVARAFSENVDTRHLLLAGNPGKVNAKVVDSGLKRILGNEIELTFNLPGWKSAAFNRQKVSVYLEGIPPGPNMLKEDFGGLGKNPKVKIPPTKGASLPLMVKFKSQKGIVIFTAFHNSVQNDAAQLKLLQYMVFSAVNAQV